MFSREDFHQALSGATAKTEAERPTPGMGQVRGWPDPRGFWHKYFPRGSVQTFAAATVLVAFATLVRAALAFLGDPLLPFTTYYPAVLFATYVGGLRVGLFAAFLGGIIGWWAFLPPHSVFLPVSFADQLEMVTYVFACALLIWGAENYRRLVHLLRDEENFRKLAVEELAHRLRNKIATIQSIISYQLRDQPKLKDDINGRLVALSATDDLIIAAQAQGAAMRDILSTELGAYEVSRVSMEGPEVFLPAKLAITMTLLFHELATNAAKYGALSSADGKLFVLWSLSAQSLSLEWRENGGPTVTAPTRQGFGLRLISAALAQFNGAAETIFVSTGLVCKMRVTLPAHTQRMVTADTGANVAHRLIQQQGVADEIRKRRLLGSQFRRARWVRTRAEDHAASACGPRRSKRALLMNGTIEIMNSPY